MNRRRIRTTVAAAMLAAAVASTASACGDDDNGGGGAGTPNPSSIASSLASQGRNQASSAVSSAKAQFSELQSGVNAKGDVKVSDVGLNADERAEAKLTIDNGSSEQKSYVILVLFKDSGGAVQDATVVTVNDVAGNNKATAVAVGNRTLSADIKLQAEISAAVKY